MAPPRIPKEDWDRHEALIKDLYFNQGLVVDSKAGRRSLVQVMKDEHDFHANANQYEAQLNKWGTPKYLKKSEAQLVLPVYRWLRSQDIETRVSVSGRVLGEGRLQRAQRHARIGRQVQQDPPTGWLSMPQYKHISIETRDATGNWVDYSYRLNANPLLPPDSAQLAYPESGTQISPRIASQPFYNEFDISRELEEYCPVPQMKSPLSRPRGFPEESIQCQIGNNPDLVQTFSSIEILFEQTPFLRPPIVTFHRATLDLNRLWGLPNIQAFSARLLSSVLMIRRESDSVTLPSVASLSQNINNLLLEVQSDYGSCDAMLDDDIPHAILFSIANGFAGFSDIPVVALFRALRNEHHVNMKVFGFLRDAPQVIAEPVAVNLFRAAIEASDMDAVRILLKTAATRGIRINPNDLKCEIEGFSVTPMECASRLQNIELVRTLLHEGADVNKTYGDGPLHRGAAAGLEDSEKRPAGGLEWASGWGNDIPPPSFELVCLLVQAKARVRPVVIQVLALSKWPVDSRIITTLIDSITSEEHMSLLRILPSLIRLLDDSNGLHITEKLFSLCEDAQCYQCTIKTERLPQRTTNYYHAFEETSLERSLVQAVNRRNFTICKLLLRCTSAKGRGLSAAIGRGDLRIAKLLLEHGANINEGAHETSFESPDNVRERKGRLTPLMTPLGEAIRSRDDDLLALVEERGAWACMADELHVQAAAEAAAEIGDANLLGRILEFGDTHKQQPFGAGIVTAALKVAIDNNNTQCALMLLANSDEPVEAAALELALKKRNKRVVAKILENTLSFDSYHLVEEAVRWGDVDVINDLLDAGVLYRSIKMRAIDSTDGSEYGLRAAVELGSFELVDLLLSAGVNVNDSKNDMHGSEPLRERTLAAAVRCNNEDMVRYLIHKGAEPAIEQAFVFAIERGDDSCFAILMNAFRARHHSGLAGFGADILIEAMKKDNLMYFQVLIDSGVDVNSYSHKCACRPLANAIQNHSVAVVEKLLLAGAETNSIVQYYDRSGSVETPLLMAIESGNTEKLALLLQHKADVNRPARQGIRRTPLQRACELGNLAIVKLLLHRNADFNAPPAKHGGGTALQLAALSGSVSIVKYLLSLGADVHAPTSSSHGRSALENAATNGRFSMIKVLWDATHYKGFPPDEVERAMGYARDHGYPHCAEYISNLAKASLVFIQSVISTPTER